ncbi:MAG TPA: hypothetical protein EYN66_15325 [Myxococcales bacterium]|nr:hypothetical protein [Myxococcales bacterium]
MKVGDLVKRTFAPAEDKDMFLVVGIHQWDGEEMVELWKAGTAPPSHFVSLESRFFEKTSTFFKKD